MGFTEQAAVAVLAAFQAKMRIALCAAAYDVAGEAVNPKNRVDEKRQRLAASIIQSGGSSYLEAFSWVAASLGVDTNTADAALKTAIANNWNKLAGVTPAEAA